MFGKRMFFAILIAALGVLILFSVAAADGPLTPKEQLGKSIFFDQNLSINQNQACAACHAPEAGWTGPDLAINAAGSVYEGSIAGHFGNRKPPAAAYAGESPVLYYDYEDEVWVGGMFWDGRATGGTLGDPLAEQALGPFLNPLEQANPDAQAVIDKVLASSYASLFIQVCTVPTEYYECIGRAIAAYERSTEVSQFTSKYDYWLAGQATLTDQELRGMALFEGKAQCANCHVAPLFTDFTYDNLGVPRNPSNPFYTELDWNPEGYDWVDPGLGGFLKAAGYDEIVWEAEWGKQKVPTLRNVDLRPSKKFIKAYAHNGYFKSLEEIVHFYNTRDVLAYCVFLPKPKAGKNCWPAPEVADNINTIEMGNLGLNHGEELAIVAFMRTLSDGYMP